MRATKSTCFRGYGINAGTGQESQTPGMASSTVRCCYCREVGWCECDEEEGTYVWVSSGVLETYNVGLVSKKGFMGVRSWLAPTGDLSGLVGTD